MRMGTPYFRDRLGIRSFPSCLADMRGCDVRTVEMRMRVIAFVVGCGSERFDSHFPGILAQLEKVRLFEVRVRAVAVPVCRRIQLLRVDSSRVVLQRDKFRIDGMKM